MHLLFNSISAIEGTIGLLVILIACCFLEQTQNGKDFGQMQEQQSSLKKDLTMRSSKEWNEITKSLPEELSKLKADCKPAFKLESSLLTAILIA